MKRKGDIKRAEQEAAEKDRIEKRRPDLSKMSMAEQLAW